MGLFKTSQQTYVASSLTDLYRTDYSGGKNEKEETWQQRVRWFIENIGFVNYSLNYKSTLVALCPLEPTHLDGTPLDNSWLNGLVVNWADSLEDEMYRRTFQRSSVGEYWNCYTTQGWLSATTPQLYPAQKEYDLNHRYHYVLLRPNDNPQPSWLADPKNALPLIAIQPIRHVRPGTIYSREATSDIRPTLRELELYVLLTQGIINDRKSLSQWAKVVYLGEDDGKWRQDPNFAKNGVPPLIRDFMLLNKDRDAEAPAPTYPTMGPQKPERVDLAAPIDPELIPLLDYLVASFARAVNMPVRMITGESGNDWSDAEDYRRMINTCVKPDAIAVANDITDTIWRPLLKKLIRQNPKLKQKMDVIPDLVKLTPNFEPITAVKLTAQDAIQLLTTRVINFDYTRQVLDIPNTAKFELPAELSENEAIEQALTRATRNRAGSGDAKNEPVQAYQQLALESHTAAIEPNSYKEIKGRKLDDSLARLEWKLWGELNGILASETKNMADRIGRKIIRRLSDAKTASAKTQLETLRDTIAADIPFVADKTVLAAAGIDLDQTVKEERHNLEEAIVASIMAANVSRSNLMRHDMPDNSRKAASVGSYAIMLWLLNHKKLGDEEANFYVPSDITPDILAAAGGADVSQGRVLRTQDGAVLKDGRSYIPGFAVGLEVQNLLKERGKSVRYRWLHDHPKTDFPPHLALNGITFNESERLTATGGMHPGDHRGCLCSIVLEIGE